MDSLTSAAAAAGWVAAAAAAAAAATVVVTVAPADGPAHGSARRSGWQAESIIAAPAEERRAAIPSVQASSKAGARTPRKETPSTTCSTQTQSEGSVLGVRRQR